MAVRDSAQVGEMDSGNSGGGNYRLGCRQPGAFGVARAMTMRAFLFADAVAQRLMWVANLTLFLTVLAVVYFAADRAAPFAVLSVAPASARAGEWITIKATVRRDVERQCSADYSRFLFDSNFSRYDLGTATASSNMIAGMNKTNPGGLSVSIKLPESIAVGSAVLVTSLEYRCNKIHRLWPIEVTSELPFTVLP